MKFDRSIDQQTNPRFKQIHLIMNKNKWVVLADL